MDLFCEHEPLDLNLYSTASFYEKNTSYGFLTRGCPNKCAWCIVPKKEGALRINADIDEIAQGCKNVVLMDNNILANREYAISQFNKIINKGYRVDFNQGMDARNLCEDDEIISLMVKMKWIGSIRLACDQHSQIEPTRKVAQKFRQYGINPSRFFVYTIIKDFDETLDRLRQLREIDVRPFAQPYRDFTPKQIIPQWQKDMARWVNRRELFGVCDFADFSPRKGFTCKEYLK